MADNEQPSSKAEAFERFSNVFCDYWFDLTPAEQLRRLEDHQRDESETEAA